MFVLRRLRPAGFRAAAPLGRARQRTERWDRAEGRNDGGKSNVDYLQTRKVVLGQRGAVGRGIGCQNLQAQRGVEAEALLVEQLGGRQARVGQPHEVQRLQTYWLDCLWLQSSDLAEGEAGDNATERFLDHKRLRGRCGRVGCRKRAGISVNDAHGGDGELDRTSLNWHEGGVSSQASGDQLDPPDWDHAVGGPGRLLGVQGEMTEQVRVGLRSERLRHALWRKVLCTLRSVGGRLSAAVDRYAWFSHGRSRGSVLETHRSSVWKLRIQTESENKLRR